MRSSRTRFRPTPARRVGPRVRTVLVSGPRPHLVRDSPPESHACRGRRLLGPRASRDPTARVLPAPGSAPTPARRVGPCVRTVLVSGPRPHLVRDSPPEDHARRGRRLFGPRASRAPAARALPAPGSAPRLRVGSDLASGPCACPAFGYAWSALRHRKPTPAAGGASSVRGRAATLPHAFFPHPVPAPRLRVGSDLASGPLRSGAHETVALYG